VIGGGFSGINTALELAEKGITNIVVLEARYLGFGGNGTNIYSQLTVAVPF
jgi:gamma-glutamylputrescine oxidase